MTGEDPVKAIENNATLMGLKDCPSVPIQMSCAVYGKVQNDVGNDVITNNGSMKYQIDQALLFRGLHSETAVWHFSTGPVVHHFVVIPWYRQSAPQGTVYTVFMAYEGKYLLVNYVKHNSPAPGEVKGYKTAWTENDLRTMLSDLLTKSNAWEEYFGNVGPAQANIIHYYKYKTTTLDSAVSNVNRYRELCR
ncbi:hypothetical protein SAMN03159355_00272 [Pseudomonas sp. NFPP10]|uniref:hypothetical protein n=1 Tax=unclassified Pseudomonas TaxID=196821 RepID=UPI00088CB124|nr:MULTISPECIES: hypothetical protein [unclassified Pseudomonas]SDA12839.1 hypothetical protein SAMN03159465_00820 [Pseudomonas sp. NFPP12]SEK35965.1 hypothetical protein SAMN03159355_00272 [Pseudomonas sp. NFPP10]SFI02880.1 hypothetical protein SAMN03159416_00769 [Pseudomonas sp. NFPP08]SFM19763.1 hypothetical protein SAMN03159476_00820 [Pseudomonas sp. NFPP05]SFX10192.1 hypothetical protein SAMN03159479_00770 [Pseudomonas sp. NFPP09]